MSVGWNCTGDLKRSLIYKLIYLENARNAVSEELLQFTEKTAEETEDFLNSPSSTRTHDGANLLKTLDAKCRVINELLSVFRSLKSERQRLKIHLTPRVSLSPQRVLHFKHQSKTSPQNGVFIPNVLKFGPLLQNVIQESSIAKAVQIIGASLSLQQMALSLESEKGESSGKISTNYGTENELFSQHSSKASQMETDRCNVQQSIIATEAEIQRNAADDCCPSLIQNVTTHVFKRQFAIDPEVQHQKQTSSQLMCFLRINGKKKNVPEVSLFGSMERAFVLMQHQKVDTEATNLKEITFYRTHKRQSFSEMRVSGPIFKVKNSCAGFVTYTCVIATHSELWDIGYISTEVKNSSQGSVSDEKIAVPYCNDSKMLDLIGQTVGTSSDKFVASENLEHQCDSDELTDGTTEDESLVRIPEFQIKKFEEMPVLASHIVSPGKFYIQHKDAKLQKLSEIMARKTGFKSCAERNCIPDIGAYVMGWFSEQKLWCRAQVTKICGMNRDHLCTCCDGARNLEVEVRRIDYGDSACLSLSNVKELCGEAAKVPLQALQVSLANVNPVNGHSWSVEAIHWFKDKLNGRTLYARLYPEESRVKVELFLEKGKIEAMRRGASLSLRLAQNGHAKHEQMKNMGLKRSHAQEQARKQSLEWEKYLISCYSQNRK